jgi:predicted RNA-binding Zn-ribbon protein involved in translation (DUF1610 family)
VGMKNATAHPELDLSCLGIVVENEEGTAFECPFCHEMIEYVDLERVLAHQAPHNVAEESKVYSSAPK